MCPATFAYKVFPTNKNQNKYMNMALFSDHKTKSIFDQCHGIHGDKKPSAMYESTKLCNPGLWVVLFKWAYSFKCMMSKVKEHIAKVKQKVSYFWTLTVFTE